MSRMTHRPSAVRASVTLLLLAAVLSVGVGCQSNPFLRKQTEEALRENNLERAERLTNQAIAQDPGDWKSQYYRGVIKNRQGSPLEAQLALEKALSMRGSHEETPMIVDELAESIYLQNDPAALHTFLRRMTDRYGKGHDYLRQAEYLAKLKDYDAAKVAYHKAARFWEPNDPKPYLEMADFYESIGDTPNAVIALRRAYGINPNLPSVRARLLKHGVTPGSTIGLPPERQEDGAGV